MHNIEVDVNWILPSQEPAGGARETATEKVGKATSRVFGVSGGALQGRQRCSG